MTDLATQIADATEEIRVACAGVAPDALGALAAELLEAGRIVVYGVGREGLMMRALAMRLFHLGLDVHVVGDMTTPPIGSGDLLLVSAGPGAFSTVMGLIGVARGAGARVACVTSQPDGDAPLASDRVLVIPAQTMADDRASATPSVLPMGSLFEGAQFLVFEMLVLDLRARMGLTADDMRARHTNLE